MASNIAGLAALGTVATVVFVVAPIRLGGGQPVPTGGGLLSPVSTVRAASDDVDPATAQLAVIEAVNADPVNFGGVYIAKDGVLVIQYVGTNAGRAAIEQVLTPAVSHRWERVDYSRSDLTRIATEVRGLNLEDVFAVSAGTSSNQVIVYVASEGSVSEVSRTLASYGGAVRVEFSSDIPVVGPAFPSATP